MYTYMYIYIGQSMDAAFRIFKDGSEHRGRARWMASSILVDRDIVDGRQGNHLVCSRAFTPLRFVSNIGSSKTLWVLEKNIGSCRAVVVGKQYHQHFE